MIRMDEVSVVYPTGVCALQPTCIEFKRGRFTVLLGASGAGKSTLLRTLNGLVRPTHGDILVSGHRSIFSSGRALREHRSRTGMIFQQHHLIGRMTALRNVLMGRLAVYGSLRTLAPMRKADRLIALEALDRVGLVDRALHRVDELSGGQQQRVGIARAMAQRPQIILADEPVASLDPATAAMVLADLHRICREDQITAIVSLHQVDLARQFADHVICLAGGRCVFEGEPQNLRPNVLQDVYTPPHQPLANAAE